MLAGLNTGRDNLREGGQSLCALTAKLRNLVFAKNLVS